MILKKRGPPAAFTPAICGVRKTLGRSRTGESTGIGSGSKTSRLAMSLPSRSFAISASVWTIAPRDTLTNTASSRIRPNSRAPSIPLVAGVIGARQTTTSGSDRTLSSEVNVTS